MKKILGLIFICYSSFHILNCSQKMISLQQLASKVFITHFIKKFDPLNDRDISLLMDANNAPESIQQNIVFALSSYDTNVIDRLIFKPRLGRLFTIDQPSNFRSTLIALSDNSRLFAVGLDPLNNFRIVDAATAGVININIEAHYQIKHLSMLSEDRIAYVCQRDPRIRARNLQDVQIRIVDAFSRKILCIMHHPDGISHLIQINRNVIATATFNEIQLWKIPDDISLARSEKPIRIEKPFVVIDTLPNGEAARGTIVPLSDTRFILTLDSGKIYTFDTDGHVLKDRPTDVKLNRPNVYRINDHTIAVISDYSKVVKLFDIDGGNSPVATEGVQSSQSLINLFVVEDNLLMVQRERECTFYSYNEQKSKNQRLEKLFQWTIPDKRSDVIGDPIIAVKKIENRLMMVAYRSSAIDIISTKSNANNGVVVSFGPIKDRIILHKIHPYFNSMKWYAIATNPEAIQSYLQVYFYDFLPMQEIKNMSQRMFAHIIGHARVTNHTWTLAQKEALLKLYMQIFPILNEKEEPIMYDPTGLATQIKVYIDRIIPSNQPSIANTLKRDRDQDDVIDKGKEPMTEDEEREYERELRELQAKRRRFDEE